MFSVNQALLAAKAGASYISPFIGRLDDLGENGLSMLSEIRQVYDNYDFSTQVLVASIRSSLHLKSSFTRWGLQQFPLKFLKA